MLDYPDITGSTPLNALIIFIAFAAIAKVVDLLISNLLKTLARLSKTELDDRIIAVIHRPIFFTVLIAGALEAVTYLGPPAKGIFYTEGILYTVLSFIWIIAVIRTSNILIENALGKIADITI
ncbi:MAG: hypothetical protein ACYSR5_10560 [Planctomycetota bacterium]|jgi:hypothetical protein